MPMTAIVSILHRASGVLLFLALPLLVTGLQSLLTSRQSYDLFVSWIEQPLVKLLLLVAIFLFALHLAAGTRHLFLDLGIGIRRSPARISARIVLIFTFVIVVLVLSLW